MDTPSISLYMPNYVLCLPIGSYIVRKVLWTAGGIIVIGSTAYVRSLAVSTMHVCGYIDNRTPYYVLTCFTVLDKFGSRASIVS